MESHSIGFKLLEICTLLISAFVFYVSGQNFLRVYKISREKKSSEVNEDKEIGSQIEIIKAKGTLLQGKYTDQELVKLVQERDERAFGLIYEVHHRKLLMYAYEILHDRSEAEDIVQDAFVRFYNTVKTLKNTDVNLRPLLYKIVYNSIKDAQRVMKKRARSWELEDEQIADTETPEYIFLEKEKLSELMQAFGKLSLASQKIFSLRFFEGRSYEKIAETMGYTKEATKSEYFRIQKQLRLKLKEGE